MDPMLRMHRRDGQKDMSGECEITRPGDGDTTYDPDTRVSEPPGPVEVYEGACEIRPLEQQFRQVAQGGEPVTIHRYMVTVPHDTAVEDGDLVKVTASEGDSDLAGRFLYVKDVQFDDWQVNRRFVVEENRGRA